MIMRFVCMSLSVLALAAASSAEESTPPASMSSKDPGAAMILSTGDNLFYYKWFPIDSPAGIGASFDIFKSHYNVDRIIWRGAQAQWMARDNVFRPESEEIADLYEMEMALETKDHLSQKGAEEARKRDLSFWGYMPFFEVGQSAEAVSMSGFGPYNFEEKIRAEHPEYRLWDRAGITSGSTIEFGYPEVRKAYLDRYEKMLADGGDFSIYDGIIFYTYVENFFPRFSDQFIYSDIAARDFKQRYGVDVFTQPFDMDKYLALRGEYVTQYLRELRQVFNRHGKKLAFYIDAKEREIPMRWPSYPGILVPGRVKMDWRTWVKEGLVDEIALRSADKEQDVQPFIDALDGTRTRLSILTNKMPPELRYLYDRGVTRHIWSPELASDFPPGDRPLSDLDSPDRIAVMSVLRQIRDGQLDAPVEKITAMFHHPDLILRRQAVAAVLGRRMAEAIPALEKAAMDPENSFRAMVIDALGTLNGPDTVAVIGKALEMYPNAEMRLVARTAWSMMVPQRSDDLVALFHQSKSPYVRATIIEMLISKRAVPAIDAIPAFRPLVNEAAGDESQHLRFMAALATAYYPDRESAGLLLKLLDDRVEVVQDAAIFSLGELARRLDDRDLRESIYQRLSRQLKLYGADSKRGDREWAYRVVAEALMYGFGPRGQRHIVAVLNGDEPKLADLAWRVLFHPNDGWNFYPIDREEGEALYAYHPGPNRMNLPHKTYTLPPQAELMVQTFAGIAPDPTGQVGDIWSAAGKWTGLDPNVRFADAAGKPLVELAVGTDGKGARLVGSVGWDMPDKRFKNRLRGHFPASPVAYGVADGIVELSLSIRKSEQADALQVSLRPDSKAAEFIGFIVAKDGRLQLQSGGGAGPAGDGGHDTPSPRTRGEGGGEGTSPAQDLVLKPGAWQRLTLRLNFSTGKATLLAGEGEPAPAGECSFDPNRHYRAIVLAAAGDPGTATQVGELRLVQRFE